MAPFTWVFWAETPDPTAIPIIAIPLALFYNNYTWNTKTSVTTRAWEAGKAPRFPCGKAPHFHCGSCSVPKDYDTKTVAVFLCVFNPFL